MENASNVSRSRRRKSTILIAILTATLVFALVVICVFASSPRRSLDRFLAHVNEVRLGSTTMDDWRKGVQKANLSNVTSTCDQKTCVTSWHGQNTIWHKLHLAPLTVAQVDVTFGNGIASEIDIALVTQAKNERGEMYDDTGVIVRQTMDGQENCEPAYKVLTRQRYHAGEKSWATVKMDSCVTAKLRANAFAINTACLTKIGACQTFKEILPQVF